MQLILPGCEDWRKPTPLPGGLRRTLEVIAGYSRGSWGECRAFYRTLARVLHRSVRWVAERIAAAKRIGALIESNLVSGLGVGVSDAGAFGTTGGGGGAR